MHQRGLSAAKQHPKKIHNAAKALRLGGHQSLTVVIIMGNKTVACGNGLSRDALDFGAGGGALPKGEVAPLILPVDQVGNGGSVPVQVDDAVHLPRETDADHRPIGG